MEAITIAGLAVVAVGGYFSVIDFLGDLRIVGRIKKYNVKESITVGRDLRTAQTRIKKMAGMHI